MRRWQAALCLLIVLPATGYLSLPWLASLLVERWLVEQGFSHPHFSISHPDLNSLQINQLSVSKQNDHYQLSFASGPVLIRYTPTRLLFEQQLDDIQIPSAQAQLNYHTQGSTQTNSPPATLALLPLLPGPLMAKLPAKRLVLGELEFTLHLPQQPVWQLRGALDLTRQQLISRVYLNYAGEALGWSDFQLNHQHTFNASLLYQNEPFLTLQGQLNLPAADQPELHVQLNQQLTLQRLQQWLNVIAPGLIEADAITTLKQLPKLQGQLQSEGDFFLPTTLALDNPNWLATLRTHQNIHGQIQLTKPKGTSAGTAFWHPQLHQLKLDHQLQLQLKHGQLQLSFDEQSHLTLDAAMPDTWQPAQQPPPAHNSKPDNIASFQADLTQDWQLTLPLFASQNANVGQSGALQVKLTAPALQLTEQNLQIRSTPLHLKLRPFALESRHWQGELKTAALSIHPDWPTLALTQRFTLTPEQINTQFDVALAATDIALHGDARWLAEHQSIAFNWQLQPLPLAGLDKLMRRFYAELPNDLYLHDGQLQNHGKGHWQNGLLQIDSWHSLHNLTAELPHKQLEGGQWRSHFSLRPDGSWRDQGTLQINQLHSGVTLRNIQTEYMAWQDDEGQQRLALTESQLSLLGGQLSLSPIIYDRQSDQAQTVATLKHVQVSEILALEQQQGLSGDGMISGQLPLLYHNGAFSIAQGQLHSLSPGGIIRFQPGTEAAAIASGNPGLSMALDALENFHYHQMDVSLDYQPDGTALLATRLQGHNPDWNKGRAVDLSINVEENIPKLLQTLQITDKLTDSLRNRYR